MRRNSRGQWFLGRVRDLRGGAGGRDVADRGHELRARTGARDTLGAVGIHRLAGRRGTSRPHSRGEPIDGSARPRFLFPAGRPDRHVDVSGPRERRLAPAMALITRASGR